MTIFTYTLKQLLRRRINLLLVLLIPSVVMGLIYGLGFSGSSTLTVGIADYDDSQLTRMLVETVGSKSTIVLLNEEEINRALARGTVDYVLVIDEGFSAGLIAGQNPRLQGYSIQESNISLPLKVKIEGFMAAAKSLAKGANGDNELFYVGLERYVAGNLSLSSEMYADEGKNASGILSGMGLVAMIMMMLASHTAIHLIKDRENRTFYRVLATPINLKSYMLQSILCFLLLLVVKICVVLLIGGIVFNIYLGPSIGNLLLVMIVFAMLCVAMGVALAALARNVQQAGTISSLVIVPISMLGGLFWPRWIMPDFLQTVAEFLPTTRLMMALETVLAGNSLIDAGLDLAILLGFTGVFFLLGTWRQTDIAS